MEKYHGNTVEYWKQNAEEDYIKTPISVLKYITVLEEQAEQLRKHAVMPSCEGNCGMNYCDDNGCIERTRILVEPTDLPEHEA